MVGGSETKLGPARVAVERGVDAAATDSLPGVARGLRLVRAKRLVVKPELERAGRRDQSGGGHERRLLYMGRRR